MKRRLLSIVLAATLVTAGLTGCGKSAPDAGKESEVQQAQEKQTEAATEQDTATASTLNEDEEITLNLLGPGLLSSQKQGLWI